MDVNANHALRMFREKVGIYNGKRWDEGDQFASINLYNDIVAVLEQENPDVVATLLIELLDNEEASDMHYWIFIAVRGMGDRGKLSHDAMKGVLTHTEVFAAGDAEEWYNSINMLAFSSEGANVLLDFVENRLLGQRNIRGWRWLAIYTTSAISGKHAPLISMTLKNRLAKEVEQETNSGNRQRFQKFLAAIQQA